MIRRYLPLWGVLLLALVTVPVSALDVEIREQFSAGAGGAPFWLQANQWGLVSDSALQNALSVAVGYNRHLGHNWYVETLLDVDAFIDDQGFQPRLRFGYGALAWRQIQLIGGVFPGYIGEVPNPDLSSGSLSVSGNARPIPKIQLSSDGYIVVPFTREALQVKGGVTHGWYTGDRYQGDELLHEKWSYLRLGQPTGFGFYGGLVHHGTWGGDAMEVTWDNYRRVILAQSGGSGTLETFQRGNIGNHRGIWDFGFNMPFDGFEISAYFHKPYEQSRDLKWRNGRDGLYGLLLEMHHDRRWPSLVLMEGIRTVYQSGKYHTFAEFYADNEEYFNGELGDITSNPGEFNLHKGRSRYYSHGIYRNGWTHQDRIIGTPFFMTTGSGADLVIASNRVIGGHFAVAGSLSDLILYNAKVSRMEHLSTYLSGAPRYAPATIVPEGEVYSQWHFFLGFTFLQAFGQHNLDVDVSLGLDIGQMYDDAFGFSSGLVWRF